jgi:hypothetical protein
MDRPKCEDAIAADEYGTNAAREAAKRVRRAERSTGNINE